MKTYSKKVVSNKSEAFLFSCTLVGQQTPREVDIHAGIWPLSEPEFSGRSDNRIRKGVERTLCRDSRKSFDYFTLRADLTFGVGRKILGNVIGHGLLFGKNIQPGNLEMLIGGFQHYDFWDNKTFELGTIAFGGGMISKLPVSTNSNLSVDVHLGIVPLAGNSTRSGPDTSQFRDYNYGGGAEGKLETTLNFGGWASVTVRGYYYWIHTYVGNAGDNVIGILKPSAAFRLARNLSVGFEQLVYFSDRHPRDFPEVHDVRTEQKMFLQFSIDNFKQER